MINFNDIDDSVDANKYFRKQSKIFYRQLIEILDDDHLGVQCIVMLSVLAREISRLDFQGDILEEYIKKFRVLYEKYKSCENEKKDYLNETI